MRILFVCSGNEDNGNFSSTSHKPFFHEQRESLISQGLSVDTYYIKGHGFRGYLNNIRNLRDIVNKDKYDLVHAHFGLAGMVCVLQTKVPVIISFLGSDIEIRSDNVISSIASSLARASIFVSPTLYERIFIKPRKNHFIIPYGVDLSGFFNVLKQEARMNLGLEQDKHYVLFSSRSDIPEKNYPLARMAMDSFPEAILMELGRGFSREEVNLLMNASDVLLMTSVHEGSPQVIKEAMACGCPIVSTDVGDVRKMIEGLDGCFICSFDPGDVAEKIRLALEYKKRTLGRDRLVSLELDVESVAKKLVEAYKQSLSIR